MKIEELVKHEGNDVPSRIFLHGENFTAVCMKQNNAIESERNIIPKCPDPSIHSARVSFI